MNTSASADLAGPGRETRRAEYQALAEELARLRSEMLIFERRAGRRLAQTAPTFRDSAGNLLHYVALRRHDLRVLQERLARLGLSSLGRAEAHVAATVDATLDTLHAVLATPRAVAEPARIDFGEGYRCLNAHTQALLGPEPAGRTTRIMVTMPSAAAEDYTLIRELLRRGMDCMRVNCAHDDANVWARMIENLRRAEQETQRSCRLFMDLAGPKLRTGPLSPGPAVVKVKPARDAFGRVQRPAQIWLTAADAPQSSPGAADAVIPVRAAWLRRLRTGDEIRLEDARGALRHWRVVTTEADGCRVECDRTCYLVPRLRLHSYRADGQAGHADALIGDLPHRANFIVLHKGDRLLLVRSPLPGHAARRDRRGRERSPATIGCTPPEAIDAIRARDPIWFDDGRIGGIVEGVDNGVAQVRITHAPPDGAKLRSDKGINLPESQLQIPALTDKDLADLPFIAAHADMVGLSFVNRVEDIERLRTELDRYGTRPAIVLKIETRHAFQQLPDLLLAAMREPVCGVMIARGDLAVECGFERLAEVQEELLWLCEAAHVPVIWATQVLESLAKEGLPSRAEITDAAMGHRAECVMLNKGPHIIEAVDALDNILRRMQGHQSKKMAKLRPLHLATAFSVEPPAQ
jgi:pyruvate kinase